MAQQYMVKVYAYLVKVGRRDIDSLPEAYRVPVTENLASQVESETPFLRPLRNPMDGSD